VELGRRPIGARKASLLLACTIVGILVAGLAVSLVRSSASSAPTPQAGGSGTVTRPFAPSSPLNTTVPATGVAARPRVLSTLASGPVADVYADGLPIYSDVTASTPRYRVGCTEHWGVCDLERQRVPIPGDAVPGSGRDHDLVVVDPATRRAYELWRAVHHRDGTWSASWGDVTSLDATGVRDVYGHPSDTGSGLSVLAGVVTLGDVNAGHIDHALSFGSSITCRTWVAPAIGSDGTTPGPSCLPEGSRVRLDPAIDLAAIPGITPLELMVGRALQTYGAYCKDTAGAPMAFVFQHPEPGDDPYPALGLPYDYWQMPHLPWAHLRLVSS
jgi:hypothetical protein